MGGLSSLTRRVRFEFIKLWNQIYEGYLGLEVLLSEVKTVWSVFASTAASTGLQNLWVTSADTPLREDRTPAITEMGMSLSCWGTLPKATAKKSILNTRWYHRKFHVAIEWRWEVLQQCLKSAKLLRKPGRGVAINREGWQKERDRSVVFCHWLVLCQRATCKRHVLLFHGQGPFSEL